jgi:hypothetical protein
MTRFATLGRSLPLSPAQAIDEWAARCGVSLTSEQRMSLRLLLTDREIDAEQRALRTARNEALDEAAQLVFPDISFSQGLEIATAIRALKS